MTTYPKEWDQEIGNDLLICVSKNKKSSLHIDYDSLLISFKEYAQKYQSKIKSKFILRIDSNFTSTLPYYKMEIYFPNKEAKVWIALYECKATNSVAKVVGITTDKDESVTSLLRTSVNTVQLYNPSTYKLSYTYVELVPASFISEWKQVEADTNKTFNKLTQIMNAVKDTNQLNTSRLFYKKISSSY